MQFSEQERTQGMQALQNMAISLLKDKNRIAKAIAAFLRNQVEDFHVNHLTDEQMKSLNPLIRGAVFSFLVDYGDDYAQISVESNIKRCVNYILTLTVDFLRAESISERAIKKFSEIIIDQTAIPLLDLSKGGGMLAGYEWMYVPDYWEDCEYFKIH